jgi:hypothetical protein
MPEEELEDEDEELAELAVGSDDLLDVDELVALASESLPESLEEDLFGGMLDKKLAHAHRLPVPDGTPLIFFLGF